MLPLISIFFLVQTLLISCGQLYYATDKQYYFYFNDSQVLSYLNEMEFAQQGSFEFVSISVPYSTIIWQILFALLLYPLNSLNTHF